MKVIIIGAGIGGLSLALELHDSGIDCRVYEAVSEFPAVGVGINLLPHASKVLSGLGLEQQLADVAVTTKESAFFNRFGQLIYREPAGRYAGYEYPQFSIHRGELQAVLLNAVRERLGDDAVVLGHRCVGVEQDAHQARALLVDADGNEVEDSADVVVGCDGVHSAVRKQFHPNEGEPVYSGINMWRGVVKWKPAGWFTSGKMVIYPIQDVIDDNGDQLVNWVAEIETPQHARRYWNRRGRLEDFVGAFSDWHFDWLDVPALMRGSDEVLEYPMVDQEPLESWGSGRITLLGDAAHPMVPRGSNGAGQAIVDARTLRTFRADHDDALTALRAYEQERIPATAKVVLANRVIPPDVILREVMERSGDQPFDNIDEIIAEQELEAMTYGYKKIAGYTREGLRAENGEQTSDEAEPTKLFGGQA